MPVSPRDSEKLSNYVYRRWGGRKEEWLIATAKATAVTTTISAQN